MDQLEAENEQVAGDTDSEEDEDEDDDDEEANEEKKAKEKNEDDPKLRAVAGLMTEMNLANEPEVDDDQSWN
jgi:hypothetical protein